MPKTEQEPQPKTDEEVKTDLREGMTLGEACDISSMTLLRRRAEQEEDEEKDPRVS